MFVSFTGILAENSMKLCFDFVKRTIYIKQINFVWVRARTSLQSWFHEIMQCSVNYIWIILALNMLRCLNWPWLFCSAQIGVISYRIFREICFSFRIFHIFLFANCILLFFIHFNQSCIDFLKNWLFEMLKSKKNLIKFFLKLS